MAAAGSCRVWAVVAAVLTLAAVVRASTLTVFGGPGCTGNVTVLSSGSCQTIDKQGGYYFSYTTGIALLYSTDNCSDSTPNQVLDDDEWHCESFSYNSVYITRYAAATTSSSSWDITARQQQ